MCKNRALLLDRDGVINEDTGYVGTVDAFTFLPGLFPFLRAVRDKGYRLAILTNQAGVAKGFYTEEDYKKLTEHMLSSLKREGIDVELTLACFEHPKGVCAPYCRQSFWRKPNPGMVLEIVRRLDLDAVKSALLGNEISDMQAGLAGGIGKCLWLTNDNAGTPEGVTAVRNFDAALTHL